MLDATNVATTLRDLIVEVLELEIPPSAISDETNLFDLGIDSLAVLRLVMAVQDKFGIEIPETSLDASMFERFGNLVQVVADHS